MRHAISLAVLLLCSSAFAQAPKIEEGAEPRPVISSVPVRGRLVALDQVQSLNGAEFELFSLSDYAGPVAWDASSPDSIAIPVKFFECKPKSAIIGIRAGHTEPAEYETPDGPCVAVFANGTGRAVISAWGVTKDGKPYKISTLLIDANRGPRPPPGPQPIPIPVDPPTPIVPPQPDPGPVPKPPAPPRPDPVTPVAAKVVTVIIVEDSLKRTPQTAALIADLTYWNGLAPTVETCHIVPADSDLAKQYDEQVKQAGGVPAVIVMAYPSHKVLAAEKLPADKVAMSALISKLTGK